MPEEKKLRRTLKLHECVFFGVGSILGAGIYTIIGKVAGLSGNMLWLAFAISSLTALMTAFSYAELSSVFPSAGAEYTYAKRALNKRLALVIGIAISLSGMVSGATVSIGFAGYLTQFVPLGSLAASFGIIGVIFVINATGIRQSSTVNIIFTIIEFSGLAFVIYTAWSAIGSVDYLEIPQGGFNSIFMAAALSYFAFLGFEEIVKLGEETVNPERTIPRALFLACIIVTIIYITVAVCAVGVIPWERLGQSQSPLADIVKTRFGQTGAIIISAVALFSTSNTILSNMTGASRVLYDMSKENTSLGFLSRISRRGRVPIVALILIALVMFAFAAIGIIERVALIATFFIFMTFLFVNISAITLRFKEPELDRPYRIPFNVGQVPLPSVLGILLTLVLIGYTVYSLAIGISV